MFVSRACYFFSVWYAHLASLCIRLSVIVEIRIGLRDLVSFTLQKSLIEATKTNKKLFNLKRHEGQVYKDHMKRCLIFLVLREVGIKKGHRTS